MSKLIATLYPNSFPQEKGGILIEHCFTLTEFSYQCTRSRNDEGIPFGPTLPSMLEFTFKLRKADDTRSFYSDLSGKTAVTYTFLFNANFDDENKSFKSSDDKMTVTGFLVDINEDYDTYTNTNGELADQILVHAKLVINEFVFTSKDKNFDRILQTF